MTIPASAWFHSADALAPEPVKIIIATGRNAGTPDGRAVAKFGSPLFATRLVEPRPHREAGSWQRSTRRPNHDWSVDVIFVLPPGNAINRVVEATQKRQDRMRFFYV
jgi:hypothetical protein